MIFNTIVTFIAFEGEYFIMPYFAIPTFLPTQYPSLWTWLSSAVLFNLCYGSMFLYAYSRLTKTRIAPLYYVIAGIIYAFAITIIGTTFSILLMTLVLYYFVLHKRTDLNIIAAQFFYTNFLCNWLYGLIGQFVTLSYRTISPTPTYFVSFYLLSFIRLACALIVILYVIKLTTKYFESYSRYVVTQTPLLAWCFNISTIASLYLLYAINYKMLPVSLSIFYLLGSILLICGIWFIKHTADYYKFKTLSYSTIFELTELQRYTSQIEVMYDDMRRFRHDYKNILYSLSSAIDTNDIELVKKAFDSVVIPTQKDVTTSTSILADLKNLQNIELKGLIYNKIMQALDQGLTFEVEIEHKIKLAEAFDPLDAVRCISILLDNAINAAINSKEKKVNFSFFDSEGIQYLIIGNSTKEEMIDLRTLAQQESKLGSSHGIGLKNLQMILARYPNIQDNCRSNNYWFEQVLMIPLKV